MNAAPPWDRPHGRSIAPSAAGGYPEGLPRRAEPGGAVGCGGVLIFDGAVGPVRAGTTPAVRTGTGRVTGGESGTSRPGRATWR